MPKGEFQNHEKQQHLSRRIAGNNNNVAQHFTPQPYENETLNPQNAAMQKSQQLSCRITGNNNNSQHPRCCE